jgi:threonylcarbamoyladenosine tRNA methylthiotransferase MtaB
MTPTRKKVAFHTLGCKLNFSETSMISRSFPEDQYERVPDSTKADIYVINTCSVTDTADKKCRQAVKRFINQSPDAFIAVVGCYAQLNPREISAIPGVDIVLGTSEKFNLTDYLKNTEKKVSPEVHTGNIAGVTGFIPSYSAGDRTRSFLKIQDGCDYKCSYCTIPEARGKSRNQNIESLVVEAEKIAVRGIREIVITGVNIGDYGKSTGESFVSLLGQLVRVDGIERFRISSLEPNLLSDELIDMTAGNKKIMPHFHIPLQSGSDKILGLMRRRYKRGLFEERVKSIKAKMPLAGIGADVIVGFPGESDQDFADTFGFLARLPLSYLHVFNFSERPGTDAVAMTGKVSFAEREKRSKILITLSQKKHREFCRMNAGKEAEVLFEHARDAGMINGFTENYLKVEYPWGSEMSGKIIRVRLKDMSVSGKMTAEIIQ